LLRLNQIIWRTSNKNDDDKDKQPPPKGFEKFFKKKEPEASTAKSGKDEEKKKREDEEEAAQSEEEEAADKKEKKKEPASRFANMAGLTQFYYHPNGSPIYENWLVILMLSGLLYMYLSSKSASQEITYMDFVNQYLSKGIVKMITITEDKSSDMFKYRALIETQDGTKVHLVLP
jgi:flagellar biosynthesis GTPase FlhF